MPSIDMLVRLSDYFSLITDYLLADGLYKFRYYGADSA